MDSIKRLIVVTMLAVLFTAHFAQFTTAEAQVTALAPAGTGSSMVAQCEDYPGITNRIVKCVRTTLANAGHKFFDQLYPMFAKMVTAFLTLGVAIYGVMMAAGMVEKIGRDSMVLLLKIAFVAYFVQNVDEMYDWTVLLMDRLGDSMFSFSTLNHPTAPVCMKDKTIIWERLDCLIDTTFGIKADGTGTTATSNVEVSGKGLTRGLIAFFASALLSSVPGFIIGIIGFMVLYTLIFFMVKVLFVFLMSYMALLFLMALAPMFLPLVIFKSTKQYFDNWVKLIISCVLQPVIIVAFVSFAVATLDVAVFSGDKSFVRTIAGDAVDKRPFNLNQYIESKGAYTQRKVGPTMLGGRSGGDVDLSEVRSGMLGSKLVNECGLSLKDGVEGGVAKAQECAEGWIVGVNLRDINWKKLAEARQPAVQKGDAKNLEQALMRELYASAILTAVMMFIMNALMQVVPQLANDLVGSYRQTPNMMGLAGGWKWQTQASQGASGMAQGAMQRARDSSGGQQRGGVG